MKRALLAAAAIYLSVWFGGAMSFHYTHTCLRHHTEENVNVQGDDITYEICDYYDANAHRWTFLGPIRALL